MRRGVRLVSKAPIPSVNRERKAKAFGRNFGKKSDWIRSLHCVACVRSVGGMYTGRKIEAAHAAKARGMGGCGGNSADLVPLCTAHHREQGEQAEEIGHGPKPEKTTFERRYGLDLQQIAAELEAEWTQQIR